MSEKEQNQENIFMTKNQGYKITQHLKKEYVWFERRWATMEINHKNLVDKMLDEHPQIGFYIEDVFKKNLDDKGELPKELWRVSSTEADLLCLLALPYDESEMVLTDDTGILDTSGNKILKGGKKSFKARG